MRLRGEAGISGAMLLALLPVAKPEVTPSFS